MYSPQESNKIPIPQEPNKLASSSKVIRIIVGMLLLIGCMCTLPADFVTIQYEEIATCNSLSSISVGAAQPNSAYMLF